MSKTKRPRQAWAEDVARIEQIAIAAGCDGFTCEPVEIIEMLCILDRHDKGDRAELIHHAATALLPFTTEGSGMIDQLIEQARKGAQA